jgi:hypothetical protein
MRIPVHALTLAILGITSVVPAGAQTQPAAPSSTPPLLMIYREEVRPGKTAAHAVNETAWAAAFAKGGAPARWLGMTSMAGPSEAWFLSGHESWEAFERVENAMQASAAFTADEEKFSSAESDLLSRTSIIAAAFRPALSFQSGVNLPQMRYMQVDVVRVKPGRIDEFWDTWEMIIAAHTKAKMDERWAVYQVTAGMPAGTFLFFYPRQSLAEIDKGGPMHSAAAYRDAVGESGRARVREMNANAVESSTTMVFRFAPNMSTLDKSWIDADPAFWTPKPPPAPASKKK